MEYYLDFDNTLYRTHALKYKMLTTLAIIVSSKIDKSFNEIFQEEKKIFKKENIYNIYALCEYLSNKYKVDYNFLVYKIDNILSNGKEFVYHDVKLFLRKLKNDGHKINMLTYSSSDNHVFQNKKILGSKISEFFDNIIITTDKGKENIDYKNAIFIDDNPKDLITLYYKNAKQVIRIKRRFNKYSKIHIDKKLNIKEFQSLKSLKM